MAGIGDSWGTREELLHPRDSKGRFRSKWKMSESVLNAVLAITQNFSPRTFASDGQATQYTQNLAHQKPGRFQGGKGYARLQADFENANNDLLDGTPDEPSTKKFVDMMDKSMIEAPDSFIASSVVGADAFGLTPETLGSLEDMTGNVIANRGYTAVNLGTPLGGGAGMITMSIATPKGTKIAVPGRNPGDRAIYMDRDQEFTVTKVKPDGRGGYYMWAVATPATPGENPGPEGGHAGSGHSGNREADIKSLGDSQMQRDMGEQGASQLPGGGAAGGLPEDGQGRVIPGSTPTGDDPATERAKRRAAILGRPAAPAEQSQGPAPSSVSEAGVTPAPETPQAPDVTPAPSGVQPPNGATSTATGEAQASFRDKIDAADLESPTKAARPGFNKAIADVESGKRNPADVERDLKADIADLKRQAGKEGTDTEQLNADADKLQKLSDVIGEHFQTPSGRSRTTGEPAEIQGAEKPVTKAPKDAPARGPKTPVGGGEKSDFEKKMDARLAVRKEVATKPDPAARKGPSPVEVRAEKQLKLLNDTGARPAPSKKVNPKKIGVQEKQGNQFEKDLEDDRLNAEQRAQWEVDTGGAEPSELEGTAGNILLDEVADLLRNGRITKPKAAARLRDQARNDDDAGAQYLRDVADFIENDESKAKKRVPLKPKRGVVPDEAEASLAGRTERNILTGLNQLDVGNLRGLADKWGVETRGDDKKLKTKAVLAKELAAHWKATPSLQTKAPDAEPVDELDELLLPQLKERAKAEGIKLNSKMRKAEILDILKQKRDGGEEAEAAPDLEAEEAAQLAPADLKTYNRLRKQGMGHSEAIDVATGTVPPPAKKVAAKKATKKLPPGGMTPEEFAEASPRILAGEDVDTVGRDILGRRGAAAELDLPIEGTGPDIADADTVKTRLQDIGDNGNNADAIAYMDSLKLGAKDLRQLADDLGVPITSKQNKTQVRDAIINVHATGRQNTRAIRNALRDRDSIRDNLQAPKTPAAKDLAAVAEAPDVPKPIAKAAAKAAKTADQQAETAAEMDGLYHPDVATKDLKTMDDLSTEDRIMVTMLKKMAPQHRGPIMVQMDPETHARAVRAEQIVDAANAAEEAAGADFDELTTEDLITVDLLKKSAKFPGMRETILKQLEPQHRGRVLRAEQLAAAEAGAPAVPVPAKKAAKKITPKVMAEVVSEAQEKIATTKGPKKVTPWERVGAHVLKRIGEIDPDMRDRVLAEMPEKDRDGLLEAAHRVELQRTQVTKGGGDLDQIMADKGIEGPPDSSPSGVAFDRARDAVAKGFPDQAVKELKRDQQEAKQEKTLASRSAVDPALSPRAREEAVRRAQRAAVREEMSGKAAAAVQAAPEIEKKPGPASRKIVDTVVGQLPEEDKESWGAATVDTIRDVARTGGIELPEGVTTKEEALQEVIKELARKKLAGEPLPEFHAPEPPRAPEPTLPKASANIKGDTVEGHSYRETVRLLESGDLTPAQASKRMKDTSKYFREQANTVNNNGFAAPEARIAARDRILGVADQYEAAAKELRARKRVPKPAVVQEVLAEAAADAVPKAPLAQRLREATSVEDAAQLLDLGRNKKPYQDLMDEMEIPHTPAMTVATMKKRVLGMVQTRANDAAMGRALRAPQLEEPAAPDSVAGRLVALQQAATRAEGEAVVEKLKLSELKDLARSAGIAVPANASRPRIQQALTTQLVQRRLDSAAVSRPMPTREPGESIADWTKRAGGFKGATPEEVLARPVVPTKAASLFADPVLAEAMRQTSKEALAPPAPAKKATRGIPEATKERLAAAKKASVEAKVETRMDVAKATKAAAPAAPTSPAPTEAGGYTRQELMDLGPAVLKGIEDDLGIKFKTLDRGDRVDDILRALAANPPKADGGGRSYASRQAETQKLAGEKPTDKRRLGGGTSVTSLLIYDDGRKLIHKDQRRNFDDPKELTDADTMGASVLNAVTGGNAAAVFREDDNELYMEHIDGLLGQDALTRLEGGLKREDLGKLYDSTPGRLMGLSDALMLNSDRTPSNWILRPDGRVTGIDHGFAFAFNGSPTNTWAGAASVNPWAKYLTSKSGVPRTWVDNPFTPADMEKINAQLVALEPEFQKLDRQDWFNGMMKRFREIQDHAKGTEDLL